MYQTTASSKQILSGEMVHHSSRSHALCESPTKSDQQ